MHIQNISALDVTTANHIDPGANAVLIQIMDICPYRWPTPAHNFAEVHQFEFLDIESDDPVFDEECMISHEQASHLVAILRNALANNANVVVHCNRGISRSGAVAAIGVMMGFDDAGGRREPNQRVTQLMLAALNSA
jgi:protein-tyrosine phosphatase